MTTRLDSAYRLSNLRQLARALRDGTAPNPEAARLTLLRGLYAARERGISAASALAPAPAYAPPPPVEPAVQKKQRGGSRVQPNRPARYGHKERYIAWRNELRAQIAARPEATNAELCAELDISRRTVQRLRREIELQQVPT